MIVELSSSKLKLSSSSLFLSKNLFLLYIECSNSFISQEFFKDKTHVSLRSRYGKTEPLKLKLSKRIKKGTLFTTFHHAKSKINFLFGDESDELTKTARFKSIKVIPFLV